MDIKDGYYATLYDGSVYRTVNVIKNKHGNYRLTTTNPDDLNNGFTKYNNEVFKKDVPENEIEKIEEIRPYAVFKNDPNENKFYIIEKQGTPENMVVLITIDDDLAEKFKFALRRPHDRIFEKTVPESEVNIDYDIKNIFTNTKKNYNHLDVKTALMPIGKPAAGNSPKLTSKEQELIAIV